MSFTVFIRDDEPAAFQESERQCIAAFYTSVPAAAS
jgi:hypothetical protein